MKKTNKLEALGNILIAVLAIALVVAYAVDMANRTESRLAERAARMAR